MYTCFTLPHNRRRQPTSDVGTLPLEPELSGRVCCLAQNLLMDHIRSSLRKDVEAEMDNIRTCALPSASLLGEVNPHTCRATDSSRGSCMCRLLEEQAAAFGLDKTHTNLMQSLVDKLQINVHGAWARRKTHDADDLNVVVDELKAQLVEMQSEARAAAATAAQHIEKLTDDVRRRDDLVVKLKQAAAAAATAAKVRAKTPPVVVCRCLTICPWTSPVLVCSSGHTTTRVSVLSRVAEGVNHLTDAPCGVRRAKSRR